MFTDLSGRSVGPLARKLLTWIDDHRLAVGDRLPSEAKLCASLDVSRPAMREALSALETLGILVARKGSGRTLRAPAPGLRPTRSRLLDMLAVRQALEVHLLPAAAARLTPGTLAEIAPVLHAMELRAAEGQSFAAEDRRFHALLFRDLGNQVLLDLLAMFWDLFEAADTTALAWQERREVSARRHRTIVDRLRDGDIRQAQYHLDTHFYDVVWALSQSAPDGAAATRP